MNPILKRVLPHVTAVLTFIVLSTIYFLPQLEGKLLRQSDIMQYRGMSQEVREFQKKTGEQSLWTNAMFGGMPTYQINTVSSGNSLKIADRIFSFFRGGDQPIGRFFSAMIGFYILLVLLGVNPWLSIAGAIAFGFTTNSLILFEAGHMTKMKSITYFPLIAAGILLAFRQRYLWGGLLFALGMGLNLLSNHPQMIYYLFLTLIILGIGQFIYDLKQNRLPAFFKALGVLIIAGLFAFGSAASNLWVTMEYSNDTMRGNPILTIDNSDPNKVQSSSETEGLAWDYAMQWSNGTLDLFASFIPGVVGGGTSESAEKMEKTLRNPQWSNFVRQYRQMPPLYWGALPFTSGPAYFGAAILFLFILGLLVVKGPVKWWLGLGTLLTFMLSMGKNMEWFNELFFNYVPLYNKFRTPNSVLTVTSFLVPLLGFLGLSKIISGKMGKAEALKNVMIAGGISAAIFLFFALIGPSVFDFSHPNDLNYEQAGFDLSPLISDRQAYMRSDSWRAFILAALAVGLLWFYLKGTIKKGHLILGIILVILFDLWTVGKRYIDHDSFQSAAAVTTMNPSPADEKILSDQQPHFRVFDQSDPNTFQSSRTSYFHKSLGGYHAAKLQRYQDIIDHHLSKGNQRVFNMLNTKYFILSDDNNVPYAQLNPRTFGNAWFVNQVRTVDTHNEEIDALNEIDPSNEAAIHTDFSDYTSGLNFNKNGNISLTEYKPNRLTYSSNTNSEQLAVFSEVWYGPNKGWQAYIDGEPVEHIRANYILRAMKVPAGQHTIEFAFEPKSFRTGKWLSTIFSSLILIGFIGSLGFFGYQYFQKLSNEPPPAKKTTPKKKTVQRKTSRTRKKKR